MAPHKQLTMPEKKRIALVAHDNMKSDLYAEPCRREHHIRSMTVN